ncbi:hypothetical protein CQA53_07260 [Helicobacter didelphidarum]|uniref:Uncharacterized protein n=1 Tax=Helicobacter didelphidarum TaxID=2040648 RepID=A0A3D8IJ24_9HELI|nr:hypothetical protein [Helicobacter didelphidarum]RDU64945.1 hypothetical protein CQA53_07260 [Helicobacter didelphidarum]
MEFKTRLIDARLNIEFNELDDDLNLKATQEYNSLTQLHSHSIDKWLQSLQARSGDCKCGGGTAILGEMIVHIYKKLEHIENLITGEQVEYVPLHFINHTAKLGHGIIILDSNDLIIEKVYYVRLFLPIFPMRCVPLFAIAKDTNVFQINKISERDLKDYDTFIVGVEREALKARKIQTL